MDDYEELLKPCHRCGSHGVMEVRQAPSYSCYSFFKCIACGASTAVGLRQEAFKDWNSGKLLPR